MDPEQVGASGASFKPAGETSENLPSEINTELQGEVTITTPTFPSSPPQLPASLEPRGSSELEEATPTPHAGRFDDETWTPQPSSPTHSRASHGDGEPTLSSDHDEHRDPLSPYLYEIYGEDALTAMADTATAPRPPKRPRRGGDGYDGDFDARRRKRSRSRDRSRERAPPPKTRKERDGGRDGWDKGRRGKPAAPVATAAATPASAGNEACDEKMKLTRPMTDDPRARSRSPVRKDRDG
jgi:hypothetical protein